MRWTRSGGIVLLYGCIVLRSIQRRITRVAQGRRPPSSDIDAIEAENYESGGALKEISNPENLMLSEELRQIVFRTIESLPEDLRMAITLRELDGLSYEEIAAIMDCPVGTVRSRIFRAREAIDNKVQPLIRR